MGPSFWNRKTIHIFKVETGFASAQKTDYLYFLNFKDTINQSYP
jgi:hypothetical protein